MTESEDGGRGNGRRGFLRGSTWLMAGGLAAGYGTCAGMGARYLFPAGERPLAWLFALRLADVRAGESVPFRTPTGERVAVARRAETGAADDFVALSSVCPHLGCQVHWEPQNERFFCPCHNGVFTPEGVAVAGPPAEAGQSLSRFPLRVEDGMLFIQVPVERLGAGLALSREEPAPARGPGHDPCLWRSGGAPA